MGYFDDFDETGSRRKVGIFADYDSNGNLRGPEAPAPVEEQQPKTHPVSDTLKGLAAGTISAVTSIPRVGLLAADAVAEAGQRASRALTGAPDTGDRSYLPSQSTFKYPVQALDLVDKGASAIRGTYSAGTKQAQAEIAKASSEAEAQAKAEGAGFVGTTYASGKATLKAIAEHPAALTPLIAENVPQIVTTAAITKKALAPVAEKLAAQVSSGQITKKAADAALRKASTTVAAATEGGMTTGQVEQQIREADPEASVTQRLAAIPAGIASAAISQITGSIPGLGNVESKLATKGKVNPVESRWASSWKGLVSEGLLEEPLQEGQEQVWQNVALGEDLSKDVGSSMVQGALAGGPMGVVGGALTGGTPELSNQEKVVAGTIERIKSANLTPQELVALRESPKSLQRVGLEPAHIDEILQGYDKDAVEIAAFQSLLDNAPSETVKAGLLASARGSAYQKLVSQQAPTQQAPLTFNDAIVEIANKRKELSNRADLSDAEAEQLKSLNKVNLANPDAVSKVLGVKLNLTEAQEKIAQGFRDQSAEKKATAAAEEADFGKPAETTVQEAAPAQETTSEETNKQPGPTDTGTVNTPTETKVQATTKTADTTKTETTKASEPAASSGQAKQEDLGFVEGFKGMANVISDNFYQSTFEALKGADNAIAKNNDPVLQRAKKAYDLGLVSSPSDIKELNEIYETEGPKALTDFLNNKYEAKTKADAAAAAAADAVVAQRETKTNETATTATAEPVTAKPVADTTPSTETQTVETPVATAPVAETKAVEKPTKKKSTKAEQAKLAEQQMELPGTEGSVVNKDGTVKPLERTQPVVKAEKVKEVKRYTDRGILSRTTKRINLLKKEIEAGGAPASHSEELKKLEGLNKNIDALAEHFGIERATLSPQKVVETTEKLKKFNEQQEAKEAATADTREQERQARVAQAKADEEAFTKALPADLKKEYEGMHKEMADYRKKALQAQKAKNRIQASSFSALANQLQAKISQFRSVHSAVYTNKTETSSVDQAVSKSVQNSNIQIEKNDSESLSTVESVQGKLSEAFGSDYNTLTDRGEARTPGGFVVRQTLSEALDYLQVPADKAEFYSQDDVMAQALRDPKTGLTVLIADNLSANRAYSVAVHEVGVHGMPDITLDNQAVLLLDEFRDTAFIKKVLKRLDDAGLLNDSGKPVDANEARAYLVEEALFSSGQKELDSKFWAKLRWTVPSRVVDYLQGLATKIKQFFVDAGLLEPKSFTAQDLVNIARSAVTRQTGTNRLGNLQPSFIGQNARMSNEMRMLFNQAYELRKSGMSTAEVLDRTGWWEYQPGEWMQEITSTENILTRELSTVQELQNLPLFDSEKAEVYVYPLGSLLDFPALYEAYPGIEDTEVYLGRTNDPDGIYGSFNSQDGVIRALFQSPFTDLVPTLIHEVQHLIQFNEFWENGTNPESFDVAAKYTVFLRAKESALIELYKDGTHKYPGDFKKALDMINKAKITEREEYINAAYKRLQAFLPTGGDYDYFHRIIEKPIPTRFEIYQRSAGETLARLASFRYTAFDTNDLVDLTVEEAAQTMLHREGLLPDINDDFRDVRISFKNAQMSRRAAKDANASLSEALSLTRDGKSPEHVAEKTGWFENADGIMTLNGKSPEVEDAVQFSKIRKGRLTQADKDAVKVLEKLYGAKGKKLNEAIAEAAEELAAVPSSPEAKAFYNLTKRNFGAYKRGANRQDSSWFNRIFSSPEYYFNKTSATKEVLQAAIDDADVRYQALNNILGNFQEYASTLARKYPKLYKAAADYLVRTDQQGVGFKMRVHEDKWEVLDRKDEVISSHTDEAQAVNAMLLAEQKFLTQRLYDPQVRQFIYESRKLTNRAFDIIVADMRRQIKLNKAEGLPDPKSIFVDDDGKTREVSLSELIAHMGDLRGTYFPRERVARNFHLVAKQDGKPSVLETFDWQFVENELGNNKVEMMKRTFNNLMPAGQRVKQLIKEGYDPKNIFVKPVKTPTELLFDLPGTLSTLDSFLTEASDKVKESDMKAADLKLLAAADQALAMRIADIYRSKGNLSSRLARSNKLFTGYETDPIRALTGYATRISTGVAKRTTARRMLKAFTGRTLSFSEFQTKFGDDKTYSDYLKHVQATKIHPTEQKKLYEDTRKYMQFFLSPASGAERVVGYLKAAAVFKYLGFRVMSAAVNSTSLAISVPGTIAGHTGSSLLESARGIKNAIRVFTAFKHNQLVNKGYKFLGRPMNLTEQEFQIMNQIYDNGWAVAQFNNEAALAMTGAIGAAGNRTMQAAMYMFGKVEELNRAVTIFATYDVLARKGLMRPGLKKPIKLDTGTMLSLAKHASDRAHGIYGKAAKPWLVQNFRYLDSIYTFQKYQHSFHLNMLELLGKYKSKRAAAFLALMPQLVAGTSTASAIGFAIAKMFGIDDPQEDYETLMKHIVGDSDLASEIVTYGIFGALTGVSFKGSLETRSPLPNDFTELAGAPQAVINDLWETGKQIKQKEYLKALESFLPAAVSAPVKGYRETTEGLTKANYAPVFYEGQRVYGDTSDFLKRIVSASPTRLTEIRNKEWREDEVRRSYQERRAKISSYYNHLLAKENTSAEEWADLWLKVDKYNSKAARMPAKYMLPQVDVKWLIQQQKRAFTPTKYTKYTND